MCANIVERALIAGSGKGQRGWFPLSAVSVVYDHPFDAPLDHAVNIDFVNPAQGLDARVAVELSLDSARELARALLAACDRAEEYERQGSTSHGRGTWTNVTWTAQGKEEATRPR